MHLRYKPRRSRRQPRLLLLEQLEERSLLSYSITDLGTLPGAADSWALGISASGQVVGSSCCPASIRAFFWDSSGAMQDLGTLGGSFSGASGINNSAQVVGTSTTAAFYYHAFLWDSNGGMQDLGTLPGPYVNASASGINAAGQVVGYATSPDFSNHAFIWESANGMQDLNTLIPPDSDWTLQTGYAINDTGQIVGQGTNPRGQYHAFLLTPNGGGAPRGRMKVPAVIDPALMQVLESLGRHEAPGLSSNVPIFEKVRASPVALEHLPPVQGEHTLPTRTRSVSLAAFAERQPQEVLFAAQGKVSLSLESPEIGGNS